jgi:hypothetical protein
MIIIFILSDIFLQAQQRCFLDLRLYPTWPTDTVPHALYLQATQLQYSNIDVWADSLLNRSDHAAD